MGTAKVAADDAANRNGRDRRAGAAWKASSRMSRVGL